MTRGLILFALLTAVAPLQAPSADGNLAPVAVANGEELSGAFNLVDLLLADLADGQAPRCYC